MSNLFGELFQLGHVVPDVDAAMAGWRTAGIEEWTVVRDFPVLEWRYRGEPVTLPIDVALAWSGGVQIELIAQLDETPSMYREFLAQHPEGGLQHYGYRPQDYSAALQAAEASGWTRWLGGLVEAGRPFCYLKPPAGSRGLLPAEISGSVTGP
ncbi:MAG: VOC family protein [Gammaproteobacteria bacterium]|nr:VOC family protein [Gammaproteobacteria bacterium]